MAELRKFFCSF